LFFAFIQSTGPTSPDGEEVIAEIEDIAKSAADQAAKILAGDTTGSATEEIRKAPEEPQGTSGNTYDPTRTDTEMVLVATDKPTPDNHPAAPETQVSIDVLVLAAP
jgi:hypothetical protein